MEVDVSSGVLTLSLNLDSTWEVGRKRLDGRLEYKDDYKWSNKLFITYKTPSPVVSKSLWTKGKKEWFLWVPKIDLWTNGFYL